MENQDIRWIQRFANYRKAMAQLSRFIENAPLNELEEQGLIQCFEYTYELAWNTIKDFYESQGETEIQGSRDAIRLAFKRGLIENGETWMKMIKSRTLTAHTYNEDVASEILKAVFDHYYPEFILLMDKFNGLKEKESNRI
ncbi:MAG: nucleotidyltransferase substrate binding protein [Desulfosalsimonadaceae bacterium]|nr:nucleotidyltransferase substrate binding protein [Desulfosalsimonadaceae bacterium]